MELALFTIFGYGSSSAPEGNHGGQSAKTIYTTDDVRFTLSKDKENLYAFFLGKPEKGKRIRMKQLGIHRYPTTSAIKRITLMGINTEVDWELTSNNFYLTMPESEMNDIATVFKFELD